MIPSGSEIAKILNSAEALLNSAMQTLLTDPAASQQQIQSAIGTMQSVRGFLL